jgi:hypothetical protein
MFVFFNVFLSCLLCNNPFSNNHVRSLLIPIFLKSVPSRGAVYVQNNVILNVIVRKRYCRR